MSHPAAARRVLEGPLLATFVQYALPSLVGLMAISTASIVDGMFVGRFVGAEALAAVNLQLPYITLLFGVSLMLALGGSIRAGHSLGAGDLGAASATFSRSVVAVVALSAGAAVLTNLYDHALYRLLGAPEQLFPLMREYFRIISLALTVQLGTLVVYYFVRLDGRPLLATAAVVTGALTNIALNGLFVGAWGLGISGAAYATGLSQLVQLAVLLSHFVSGHARLRFQLPRGGWGELNKSAYAGLSELVNEVSVGLLALLLNWLLVRQIGVHGVAAFTVVNYVTFASLMVYYGAADALHLLVSQNLGAGNAARARAFLRCALVFAVGCGVTLAAALLGFGDVWLRLFTAGSEPHVSQLGADFLGQLWPLLLFNGANVILTVYLAATNRPGSAGLLALCRSLLMPAGFLLLLGWLWPARFVLALPLAEASTLLLGVGLMRNRQRRNPVTRFASAEERAVAS